MSGPVIEFERVTNKPNLGIQFTTKLPFFTTVLRKKCSFPDLAKFLL